MSKKEIIKEDSDGIVHHLVGVRMNEGLCDDCSVQEQCDRDRGCEWYDLCSRNDSKDEEGDVFFGEDFDTIPIMTEYWQEIDPLYEDLLKVKELADAGQGTYNEKER